MQYLRPAVALLATLAALAPAALGQRPLVQIKVAGNARLGPAAVIAASGLHVGQVVTHAELDAAAQRILDTGFFAGVNYRYAPMAASDGAGGYAVTLQVSEEPAGAPVELDIPGQDAGSLWQQLKASDGFIDRQMPNNERASAYYKRAIETLLRKSNHTEEIVTRNEADLQTGKMTIICQPAHLPKIATVRFEGNTAITAGALEAALAKVALDQDYTERNFRRLLELNIRPLYEELGRLTVAFPRVKMAASGGSAVAVTAEVAEGPVWRLGQVDLAGDDLPAAGMREAAQFAKGETANWKQFMASIHLMEKVLRHNGYIMVASRPVRAYREPTLVVDVTVQVKKGPQFFFGELHIDGLDPETQQHLAQLWKIPAGAPMDQPYIDGFVRSAMPVLSGRFKTFGSELHVRPGVNVVDVTLKFR